mgnify:CR=1 FL=1
MKITRKTKIRIRKTVAFFRTLLFGVALLCIAFTICSVDGPSFVFPLVCFGIGVVCFGISYVLDCLLFETL